MRDGVYKAKTACQHTFIRTSLVSDPMAVTLSRHVEAQALYRPEKNSVYGQMELPSSQRYNAINGR